MKLLNVSICCLICLGMTACASTSRNDLLVDKVSLPIGKLVLQFQDIAGFTSDKRDKASYNILARLDDIPFEQLPEDLYLKVRIYSDEDYQDLVFEGAWLGGAMSPRVKYRDWIIGRYRDVGLDFKDHFVIIAFSSDGVRESSELPSVSLPLEAKRVTKQAFLDMF